MLSEVVLGFDGASFESGAAGQAVTRWVDQKFWGLARDKNRCIIHCEVLKISSANCTVKVVAEDSSGRVYQALTLASPSRTSKGVIRVVIADFAAYLKVGVEVSGASQLEDATVALEYTLKAT